MGVRNMMKLPEDVTISMLVRLSVKSLLRYRCTCKSWYTLLQSSSFINLHLNRPYTVKDELILFKRSMEEEYRQFKHVLSFLCGCDDNRHLNPVSPDMDISYMAARYASLCHSLVGPCNGLIAVMDTENILVLNPAARKYKMIKPSPFGYPKGFDHYVRGVGFGFDLNINGYKVIRITQVSSDPYKDPYVREYKVEIYDLGIDSWSEVIYDGEELPTVCWSSCASIFYRGASHWYAIADTHVILCFDMSTDTFRNMKMPATCYYLDRKGCAPVILDESFAFISYCHPHLEIDPTMDSMDIWLMKQYGVIDSWVMRYSVRPLPIESPLTFWKDLLLLQTKCGKLISYSFTSDKVNEFNLQGYPPSLRAVVYKENMTLVPTENRHGTKEQNI